MQNVANASIINNRKVSSTRYFFEAGFFVKSKSEELRRRIVQIIALLFAGSQRSLADALAISPAQVSRVVSGLRPPSKKLVMAIGQLPQVDTEWLLTGEGTPLQTQPQILTDIGAIVPVAKELLPGPLLEFEDFLSHRFVSVLRAFYSATAYAIVVESCNCDQELLTREFLKPDDTLIIETSPDRFRDVSRDDAQKLRVMYSSEYGAALAVSESDYFRITEGLHQSKRKMNNPITIDGRKGRAIKLNEDDENNLDEPVKHSSISRTKGRIESPVVVGVVTLQMREYL